MGQSLSRFSLSHNVYYVAGGAGRNPGSASADGRRHASIDETGKTIRVHDVDGEKVLATFSTALEEAHPHLSASGNLLFTKGQERIDVTNVDTEKPVSSIQALSMMMDCSPDEKSLAAIVIKQIENDGPLRQELHLTTWNTSTGVEKATVKLDSHAWKIQFVGDNAVIIGQNRTRPDSQRKLTLSRWNVRTGAFDWSVSLPRTDHDEYVSGGFAVSPDGSRIVVSDRQQMMAVFDASSGKRIDNNPAHTGVVQWAEFSPDGKTVTTVSRSDIRIWNAVSGELKETIIPVESADTHWAGVTKDLFVWTAHHYDSKTELVAWDRAKKQVAWRVKTGLRCVGRVLCSRERIVVLGGEKPIQPQSAEVYNQTGKRVAEWTIPENVNRFYVGGLIDDVLFLPHPDDKRAVVGLSLTNGKQVVTIELPDGKTFGSSAQVITPSAGGEYVAVRTDHQGWLIADAKTGKVLHHAEVTQSDLNLFELSADRKWLAVHEGQWTAVRVFDPGNPERSWSLDGKVSQASTVAFSPDGKKAVVGYRDGTALIWDLSK